MRMTRRGLAIVLSLLFALSCICNLNNADAKAKNSVKKIEVTNLTGKKITLGKGQTFKLATKVTMKKAGSGNKKLSFTSKNKKVATVSKKGVIKAIQNGTTKIVIQSKATPKKKVMITVKVNSKKMVNKITLNKTSLTMIIDEEGDCDDVTLKAKVYPAKASNKKLAWSSSNDEIVDVSSKGVLTALEEGTVTITVKATDGSGVMAKCTVTVIDNTDQSDDEDDDEEADDEENNSTADTGNTNVETPDSEPSDDEEDDGEIEIEDSSEEDND